MTAYTKEEIEAHVAAWKEENAATGITPRDYARKIGIKPKNFSNWVNSRIKKKEPRDKDSGCMLVKIGSVHAARFPASVTIEFCGARMIAGSRESMKMVLSALKEISLT